jgi:hypothetical protein
MRIRKRVFMFGYIHQLLPAMTGVLGVATVWSDAGYLPRTGPLPLRFHVPPPAVVQVVAPVPPPFPPPFLPPYFPPVPISLPTPPMPPTPPDMSKTTNAPPASVAVTNGPALEFDAREPVTAPTAATSPDAVVSPQMLLKFFTASTNASTNVAGNAASSGAGAPFGFTPPPMTLAPTPPPTSKATYSTSP